MADQAAHARLLRNYMAAVDVLDRLHRAGPVADNARLSARYDAFTSVGKALDAAFTKVKMDDREATAMAQGALLRSWLAACKDDVNLAAWLQTHMVALRDRTAAAADTTAEPSDRLPHAVACFLLYEALLDALWAAIPPCYTAVSSPQGWEAVHELCRPFLARDFLAAVAQTALGAVSHGLCMMQPAMRAAVRKAPRSCCPPDVLSSWGDGTAKSCGRFPSCGVRFGWLAITLAMTHPKAVGPTGPGVRRQLAPPVSSVLLALAESRLLPTVAEAILRCPGPACNMVETSTLMCGVLSDAVVLLSGLYDFAASDAAAVRTALARQLDDPVVQAYHVAQLDRLAVHGGLEPEGAAAAAAQAGGAGGGGGPAEGTWWLTKLEAKRGNVFGPEIVMNEGRQYASMESCSMLESPHLQTVLASLGHWRQSEDGRDLRAPLPGPGVPTPERLAQLAARTAEALCRLYRGQGLGGAYCGAPTWQVTRSQAVMRLLLPCPEDVQPEALPYWREAAAWGLALCAEAVAAELEGSGGGPATGVDVYGKSVTPGGPARSLRQVAFTLAVLRTGAVEGNGPQDLGPAERGDALSRLRRAGLGASLNHALRLAFTAADRAASGMSGPEHPNTAAVMLACVSSLADLCGELPLDVNPRTRELGASGSSTRCTRDGDGCRALITLAKRATTLASRLEPVRAEREGPEARESGQARLNQALAILPGLSQGVIQLRKQLTSALGVPGPTATFAQTAASSSASSKAAADSEAQEGEGASAEGPAVPSPATAAGAAAATAARRQVTWALELLSYGLRCSCHLATAVATTATAAASTSGPEAAANPRPPPSLGNEPAVTPAACVTTLASCLTALASVASQPGLLSGPQLLACQPHRLLAAACRLLCAWPPMGLELQAAGWLAAGPLAEAAARAVVCLASVPELSIRVRVWLSPPDAADGAAAAVEGAVAAGPEAQAEADLREEEEAEAQKEPQEGVYEEESEAQEGEATAAAATAAEAEAEEEGGSEGQEEGQEGSQEGVDDADDEEEEEGSAPSAPERGCLERPLRSCVVPLLRLHFLPSWAGGLLALIRQAASSCSGARGGVGGEGGKGAGGSVASDEGFQGLATSLMEQLKADVAKLVLPYGLDAHVPITDFHTQLRRHGGGGEAAAVEALAAEPLPPPLGVPVAALALRRLRVCGFPGCASFGGRREDQLPLKICGGCGAVYYCAGTACRAEHWRAAHSAECRALAAVLTAEEPY